MRIRDRVEKQVRKAIEKATPESDVWCQPATTDIEDAVAEVLESPLIAEWLALAELAETKRQYIVAVVEVVYPSSVITKAGAAALSTEEVEVLPTQPTYRLVECGIHIPKGDG